MPSSSRVAVRLTSAAAQRAQEIATTAGIPLDVIVARAIHVYADSMGPGEASHLRRLVDSCLTPQDFTATSERQQPHLGESSLPVRYVPRRIGH